MSDYPATYGDVTVELLGDYVAALTIHRPPDNYFDLALIASIAEALERLDTDDRCRAAVLRSEGKHFCAGAALARHSGPEPATATGRHLYDEAVRLFATKTPVVAALRGAAVGGGLGLALAADFRVGSNESRLSANFARLGFHHGFGLTVTLPALIGPSKAALMFYTSRRLGGEDALAIGLADVLAPQDQVRGAALALAAEIAETGPLGLIATRATVRGDIVDRVRAATERELAEQMRLQKTDDFKEGVKAMAERRVPVFTNR